MLGPITALRSCRPAAGTSEVGDVVVLLQHGQGGGVEVERQACSAPWWQRRQLASTTSSPLGGREGGGVPPVLIVGVRQHDGGKWREGGGVSGLTAASTTEVNIWA